jgi:hypothetical protein
MSSKNGYRTYNASGLASYVRHCPSPRWFDEAKIIRPILR